LSFLSDELLHSNIQRYEALKQILRNPQEPSALTSEELQREIMGLLSYFVRTSRIALEMADHDFLTGLYNPQALSRLTPDLERRLFANRREGEASRRSDWVIMLDIDHFKKVNDTYGHENGNEVLRKIAQVIKTTVRTRDIVARYGGEEVFIFLFNSDRYGAERATEKIRQAIEQTEIPIKGFSPIRVTVSLGGAEMRLLPGTETQENPPLEGTLKFAIDRADEAMYQAKAAGRNRTILSSE
jgi:diguanylate cyclase